MTATTSQLVYPLPVAGTGVIRRRISPQAGHALEKLSHAIEYLSDEFLVSDEGFPQGRLNAILLLMEINRSVFDGCPEIPSLGQRLSAWLRRTA